MFGATSTFGTTGTTFGGGSFTGGGTTTNVFQPASQPSTSLFGSTTTPTFNSGFNANKPSFGPTTTFGSPTQNTSLFGQQNRPGPMFGATSPVSTGFGATAVGQAQGTSIPFNAITGSDTMMKNGVQSPISTRHQCITCMKEYEHKSLEELRYEDYQLNRKGPPQGAMFSGSVAPGTGLFSTPTSAANTAFGQRPNTFGAPATSGGLFSNLTQNKTSFFTPTTTSTFGNSAFGNLGNQPAPQTSLFGQTSTATTGGMGTTPAFSFNQQSQQQGMGLFGAKPLNTTPATSVAPFGGFGTNTAANKPMGLFNSPSAGFGTSAAPAFGTTTTTQSLFGNTAQQPKMGFGTGFGQPAPAFGAPASTSAFTFPPASTGSNLFSSTAPFGGTATTTSSFGFGSSFGSTPSFSLGNPTGGNTGFGTGTLGGFNQPSTSAFNFNMPGQNTFGQPPNQPPQSPPTGPVPFATSPYKDSPLFYNLVANRNLDDMTKPTNPLAQNRTVKEATRRTSSAHASLGTQATIKNMTFPVSKIQNFNKQNSIFDGFDDEYDHGPSIDILSPKSSVKKLSLKNVRGSARMSLPNASNSFSLSVNSTGFRRDSNIDASDLTNLTNANDDPNGLPAREAEQIGDGPNVVYHERSTPPLPRSTDSSVSVDELDARRKTIDNSDRVRGEPIPDGYNKSGIICTRSDYYIIPGIEGLNYITDSDGNCFVKNFRIGRLNYGEVQFLEPVNVAGINIDEIVMFRHKEIVVYPDSDSAPKVGEGLNVPAEVSLHRVWPLEKQTKDPIKSPERIRAMKYENLLRRSCERMDAQFVSYDEQKGTWTFRVKHFSKYSCVPEENDDEEGEDEVMTSVDKRPARGLGGIPLTELKGGDGDAPLRVFGKENEPFLFAKPNIPKEKQNEIVPANDMFKELSGSPSNDTPMETAIYDKIVSPRVKDVASMLSGRDYGGMGDYSMSEAGYFDSTVPPEKPKESQALISSKDLIGLKKLGIGEREAIDYNKKVPEPVVPFVQLPTRIPVKPPPERQLWRYCTRDQVTRKRLTKHLSLFDGFRGTLAKDLVPRRCARACFGKDGQLVVVQNGILSSELKFNGIVTIKKLDHVANSVHKQIATEENRNLVAELNFYLDSSQFKHDTLVLNNPGVILQHLRLLKDLSVRQTKNSELKGELLVWQLMDLLYTPFQEMSFGERINPTFLIAQRYSLNQWMIDNSSVLFGKLYQKNNSSMKGLLLKGRKHEACKLAVKQRNYFLSLCLSQTSEETQQICGAQLAVWDKEEAKEFIDQEIREIYMLCSGSPIWQNVKLEEMSTEEWLQHFAIYMWYLAPSYAAISDVLELFVEDLMSEVQNEDIAFPALTKTSSSMPNLCIHIIKAFSATGYPWNKLLCPKTYSQDSFDYKVSWFLVNTFRLVGFEVDSSLYESITTGFANQLETFGYWEWAIVVLKYLPPSEPRSIMIRRILERNSQPYMNGPNFNEKRDILERIHVTREDLEEINLSMTYS